MEKVLGSIPSYSILLPFSVPSACVVLSAVFFFVQIVCWGEGILCVGREAWDLCIEEIQRLGD